MLKDRSKLAGTPAVRLRHEIFVTVRAARAAKMIALLRNSALVIPLVVQAWSAAAAQHGEWAAVNGTRLYYEQSGSGADIVLIHGTALDQRMWAPQVSALEPGFRVPRYDVRGFGRSDSTTSQHDPVADLIALMDHLAIRRAHIVGMSMGGAIAADFVLAHPDRVLSLVLIASNLGGFPPPSFGERFGPIIAAEAKDLHAAKELWLHDLFMTPVHDSASVAAALRAIVTDCWCRQLVDRRLMPAQATPSAFDRLEAIRTATLVINGVADDPDMLAIAKAVQQRVRGAQSVRVPNAGHLVNLEQPAAVNDALLAFIRAQL
ncbi:MAG: alpha/beta fold hydrolase [Gemmatimonadaceae bacterium]